LAISGSSIIAPSLPGNTLATETISIDSSTPSGYLTPQVSGGFTVTGAANGQSVAINGVHLKGADSQNSVIDKTLTTNSTLGGSPLIVQFSSCGSSARTVTSGAIVTENNSSPGNPTISSFNNVVRNGVSCFPQSGNIVEKSTSKGQSSTLTFIGSGNATLIDIDGKTYNFTLRYCF